MNKLGFGVALLILASPPSADAQSSLEKQAGRAFNAVVKDANAAMKSLTAKPRRHKRPAHADLKRAHRATQRDDAEGNTIDIGPAKMDMTRQRARTPKGNRRASSLVQMGAAIPVPVRNPARGGGYRAVRKAAPARRPATRPNSAQRKVTASKSQPEKDSTAKTKTKTDNWSPIEVELAQARCTQLLKNIDAVVLQEKPFKKGPCGNAAPVRLVSVGKNPQVAVSPPALLNCDMVAALHKWVKGDLQPLARKHLASSVITIEVMSDYSCRPTYGRKGNKLSQHGRVNALDIAGFRTGKGKMASVLKAWGHTKRDIAEQLARARAAAEKADAERRAAEEKAQKNLRDAKTDPPKDNAAQPAPVGSASGSPAAGIARTTIVDGLPKLTVTLPGGKPEVSRKTNEMRMSAPQHLGGPNSRKTAEKSKAVPALKPSTVYRKPNGTAAWPRKVPALVPLKRSRTRTALFLHDAHRAACRIFGTTLGPEANEAHRNHFHVDMAERKSRNICD
jgi:hypothetical protein